MVVSRWFFTGLLLSVAGCQGAIPNGANIISQGGGASAVFSSGSASAQKKDDNAETPPSFAPPVSSPSSSPGSSIESPSFAPSSPTQEYTIAAGDRPQPGGVSALEPDPVGDGETTSVLPKFFYTLAGTANPFCVDLDGRIKYRVSGTIGARLILEGTDVPLSGCGQLRVRFQMQAGRSNSDEWKQCQDLVMDKDCFFSGSVLAREGESPEISVFVYNEVQPDFPICGEMMGTHAVTQDHPMEFSKLVPFGGSLPRCLSSR